MTLFRRFAKTPQPSTEEYLEANRLFKEGFRPVSNKYRLARARPKLPEEDADLLALLKSVAPLEYLQIKNHILNVLTRYLGGMRQVELTPTTYESLKKIAQENIGK